MGFGDNHNHNLVYGSPDDEVDDISDADHRLAGITVLPNQGARREGCHLTSQQGRLNATGG